MEQVDSTDNKFLGEGEWKRKKYGTEYRRQQCKVNLTIDAYILGPPSPSGQNHYELDQEAWVSESWPAQSEGQVTKLHIRVALLNLFTQLGRPPTAYVVAMG